MYDGEYNEKIITLHYIHSLVLVLLSLLLLYKMATGNIILL